VLKKQTTMTTNNIIEDRNAIAQKAMQKSLEKFLQDRNSAKEFSVCMKESSQWLKEREK